MASIDINCGSVHPFIALEPSPENPLPSLSPTIKRGEREREREREREVAMANGELGLERKTNFQVDNDYEFSAPQFFDFSVEETEEDIRRAEMWFDDGKSDAPSPFMMRIKAERFSNAVAVLCDFENATDNTECQSEEAANQKGNSEFLLEVTREELQVPVYGVDGGKTQPSMEKFVNCSSEKMPGGEQSNGRSLLDGNSLSEMHKKACDIGSSSDVPSMPACELGGSGSSLKGENTICASNKMRNEANDIKASSNLKMSTPSLRLQNGFIKLQGNSSAKGTTSSMVAQDNQAIKRQKLDGGRIRQIHNVKIRVLPHKSKHVDSNAASRLDKLLLEEVDPYVSVAEMIKKFETNTRDMDLKGPRHHEDTASEIQKRRRIFLTRPKEPEFQTAHRVRAVKVKTSEELEAEMLAKIPKFKARPLNKKILEAPSLPPLPKRTPQPPEFQEFNLKTMERSERVNGTASSVLSSSIDSTCQSERKVKLSVPKPPRLETALRARTSRVKTTEELEIEELEKAPKFKARPLNKKIFESRGDVGLCCKSKGQLTVPQEFHFATSERLGPPQLPDLFDKLSLHSSEHDEQKNSRITIPNPFNLQTEERGMQKEKRLTEQLVQKQIEEEKARIPKANPYPYTTDYPVIPPKPQPKECTVPEVFQLESITRHKEEEQKKMEMMKRMEKEETQRRIFRARSIMKEDPLPLPEKERKPLTEVQDIVLHVESRAEDRAAFDKRMKEKELIHKRIREETEHSKMIEEEKALKYMRKTMVPHARPVPNFSNPFHPQKSTKDATKPKSPMLRAGQRERRRRHYIR